MLRRLDDSTHGHVSMDHRPRNGACNWQAADQLRVPLAQEPLEVLAAQAQAEPFAASDGQSIETLPVFGLRLAEVSVRNYALLDEPGDLLDGPRGKGHIVVGVQGFQLQALQLQALDFSKELTHRHRLARLDVKSANTTGDAHRGEGVLPPRRFQRGIGQDTLVDGLILDQGRADSQRIPSLFAQVDACGYAVLDNRRGALRRQRCMPLVGPDPGHSSRQENHHGGAGGPEKTLVEVPDGSPS